MARVVLTTAPTGNGLIVSLQELRDHSRIRVHREGALIESLLREAQEEAERYTWRRFLKQVWTQYWDGFADPLFLRFAPLHSDGVTSLKYLDTNETEQTCSTDTWETGEDLGRPVIRREYNETWPTPLSHEDSVYAEYTCGWNTAADVPQPIHSAIRLHAAFFFRNREGGDPREYDAMMRVFHDRLRPYSVRRPVTSNA